MHGGLGRTFISIPIRKNAPPNSGYVATLGEGFGVRDRKNRISMSEFLTISVICFIIIYILK